MISISQTGPHVPKACPSSGGDVLSQSRGKGDTRLSPLNVPSSYIYLMS